uniref:Uncharacterized protein n=1 Tax=Anas platyrhynchos platyrhynchos TaxID=8840 RepID=A0A493SW44_ANAPP
WPENVAAATREQVLPTKGAAVLPLQWDVLVVTHNEVVLKNITEDLQNLPHLPTEAMFNLEHLAMQKMHQHPLPMVRVDEERMNRNYCTECGSYKTASLEFISHSFSLMNLKFLYQRVLPDLTGKVVVDAGSRLGTELFLSIPSLWSRNADFCQLQEMAITKYQLTDRIKVVHADICTQASLLQKADFIACNVKKRGSLLVTAPSLKDLLSKLQTDIQLSQWVVEVQLNYDVNVEKDIDKVALEQIYLYRIL